MDQCTECRLLVGDLLARCMDIGLSRREVMEVLTGVASDVSGLLETVEQSEAMERRVRYLHEVVRIAHSICGAQTGPWLRTENPAFGQRSPLQTMVEFPDALPGMMHLLRQMSDERMSVH